MRRAALIILTAVLLAGTLTGAPASVEYMQTALHAVGCSVVSTLAASTSIPSVSLDGVTLERTRSEGGEESAVISYLRCDLYSVAGQLENPRGGASFLGRLLSSASSRLSPLSRMAVESIQAMEIGRGDVIIDGTLSFSGSLPAGDIAGLIFSLYVMRNYSDIDFDVDVSLVVSGGMFDTPLAFEGRLSVSGDDSLDCVTLTTEMMTCNNFEIAIAPMCFSIG